MIPNINPKEMQKMMRKMGIECEEVFAHRVIIETKEKTIFIDEPHIIEIRMKGERCFQIAGIISEEEIFDEGDIKLIMERGNVTREEAINVLKRSKGDIAEALLKLQNRKL